MMTRGRFVKMKRRGNAFTLVEILVAVGLLSLIMMLLLQLFTGAQKIWTASERTNNIYADARVAMEIMADLLGTVQFSHGENSDGTARDPAKDMIFSMNTGNKDDGRYSGSIIFVAKTARGLPKKNSDTRFISFRLGDSADEKTRGKLLMVVYSDKNDETAFYGYFPTYSSHGSNRTTALNSLKTQMNSLVTAFKSSTSDSGENEYCQVIAENVVEFRLTAYRLDGGELKKMTASYGIGSVTCELTDVREPPYMIEIQLTVLDRDGYARWVELSGDAKSAYLDRHKRTFTRSVFIGDRWALEAQASSGGGN